MKIRQTKVRGKLLWLLDAGMVGGKRRRFYYTSRNGAEAKRADLLDTKKAVGDYWTGIDGTRREKILTILKEIDQAGFSIEAVWREFRRAPNPVVETVTLKQAIARCIQSKVSGGRRADYIANLENALNRFAKGRLDWDISEAITVERVEDAMARYTSGWSRSTILNQISTLCAFAVRRGWIVANPCDRIDRPTIDRKPPAILTPRQTARCLVMTRRKYPRMMSILATALFAGVRPFEIDRLTWDAFDLDRKTLIISSENSKVRQRRIVELEPTAVAWLKWAKENGAEFGVPKVSRRRWVREMRAMLKFERWPTDLLRHTAASYMVELHKNAAKVALTLGDSEKILHRHYRELVKADDCKRFWRLLPKATAASIPPSAKPISPG